MQPLPVSLEAIPEELKAREQWVVWRLEERDGKLTKVPYNARTGRAASSTDPKTWSSFGTALGCYERRRSVFDGIGFVFSRDDPYSGVDLDRCLGEGAELLPWARPWVRLLDSYAEISPSGTGVKIWVRGKAPGDRHKVGGVGEDRSGAVEVYHDARFFTMTGRHFKGMPLSIEARDEELGAFYRAMFVEQARPAPKVSERTDSGVLGLDDATLLEKARTGKGGWKFERLWQGDAGAYDGDESRADLALCGLLAFWTGGDHERIDRLFRRSGLMREKWDSRRGESTYGARTISRAVAGKTEFYRPGTGRKRSERGRGSRARDVGAETNEVEEPKKNAATVMVELVSAAGVELFHAEDEEEYGTVPVEGHRETWRLKSNGFRGWLQKQYLEQLGKVPGGQATQDAINTLRGLALHRGPELPVYTRLAQYERAIYLNLCNAEWQVVRIDGEGWEVVGEAPVRFVRRRGMLPLALPQTGGKVELLREFVNAGDAEWPLMVGWLIAALRPVGPYPIAELHGEQGSAKSTTARVLRELIDPNLSPLRTEPKNAQDLAIAAKNGWVLALDNLSGVPPWLSDALCRMATGGGLGTRELYSNDEESLFNAQRPQVLTGIGGVANRSDLLDRCLLLRLPRIPESRRRTEREFWAAFEESRALILGALLDGVSAALRNLGKRKLARLPRMADFAEWLVAAEPGLGWEPGTFMRAYDRNLGEANSIALEASAIGEVVVRLVDGAAQGRWEGTAQELLDALNGMVGDRVRERKEWPKSARSASVALRRIAPNLRAESVIYEELPREGQRRPFCLFRATPEDDANDDATGDANTLADDANAPADAFDGACADASRGSDGSAGYFSDAYIPLPFGEDGAGEEKAPEFASGPSSSAPPSPDEVMESAGGRGFPRVVVGAGISVGPGEEVWARFLSRASEEQLRRAMAMLGNAKVSEWSVEQASGLLA